MAGVAFAIPLFSSVGTAVPHFESWTNQSQPFANLKIQPQHFFKSRSLLSASTDSWVEPDLYVDLCLLFNLMCVHTSGRLVI